eukprot:TRINITY_DN24740_c0_g1_i7.p1 TRINITY_DN24740_c0_g1~~TRINITY_DN24740_c0_g1_i7.p1  ORF type:complete len:911 (-),score=61.87 TRINITY_DN24740_c0_g1_i7:760-3492(-)
MPFTMSAMNARTVVPLLLVLLPLGITLGRWSCMGSDRGWSTSLVQKASLPEAAVVDPTLPQEAAPFAEPSAQQLGNATTAAPLAPAAQAAPATTEPAAPAAPVAPAAPEEVCGRPAGPAGRPIDVKPMRHWGVVTTIFDFTPAMQKFLACWPSAGLVVVGDCKTDHAAWRKLESDRLIYLTPDDQTRLGANMVKWLPWNHFGRKNVGYIFAIKHGAELAFDFDDDNDVTCDEGSMFNRLTARSSPIGVRLVETSHHVYNPYTFFEPASYVGNESHLSPLSGSMWPRGFPLAFVNDPEASSQETCKVVRPSVSWSEVSVVQGLADHDPDVDAVYRMVRQLPVYFTKRTGVAHALPRGTFVPWNAQATLFKQSALWGMLLPVTVPGRVSDIWRSYITTTLMWTVGYHVAFTESIVIQHRNPHVYMKDYIDEQDLYLKTDSLLSALADWLQNFKASSFPEAYLDIVRHLAAHPDRFVGSADVQLAKAWVDDLEAAGYEWPELLPRLDRHVSVAISKPHVVDGRSQGKSSNAVIATPTPERRHLNPIWRPPQTGYCYRKGADWSLCAAPHANYVAAMSTTDPMTLDCLQKPLCWKYFVDWQRIDPPESSKLAQCLAASRNGPGSLKFYDLGLHDYTMMDQSSFLQKTVSSATGTSHKVFLCNGKADRVLQRLGIKDLAICPAWAKVPHNSWSQKSCMFIDKIWNDFHEDSHFLDVDAMLTSFLPSVFESWMFFNKSIVLWSAHRFNMMACTRSRNRRIVDRVRRLAAARCGNDSPFHAIGAYSVYDVEYIRHYTGVNPLYIAGHALDYVGKASWSTDRSLNGGLLLNHKGLPGPYASLGSRRGVFADAKHKVRALKGSYNMADLAGYAAVVHFPYSVLNGKLVEQYSILPNELGLFARNCVTDQKRISLTDCRF